MTNDEVRRKKKLKGDIQRVGDWLIVAGENGLFNELEGKQRLKGAARTTLTEIESELGRARIQLAADDFANCETHIENAALFLSEAVNRASRCWRFKNLYAIHIWIYLFSFLVVVFVLYYNVHIDRVLLNTLGISEHGETHYYSNGIYAATWGLIGGVLRGFWFLKDKVDDRMYRSSWILWFISCPFLGAILGTVIYFILVAGLITLTISNIDIKNSYAMIPLGLVAGFSWPSSVEQIKKAANVFSGTTN